MWLSLPTCRQVAVAPQWRVQWLLTRLHGDTALALSASARGVPAPAALLVLKTLTEATAPLFFWKAFLSIEGTLNGNRPS